MTVITVTMLYAIAKFSLTWVEIHVICITITHRSTCLDWSPYYDLCDISGYRW